MTTTAQTVSALLDDDGLRWEAADGRDLDQLAEAHGATRTEDAHRGVRFAFPDGSAIVACESAWDIGVTGCDDCYCWAGVAGDYPETDGHLPECPHAPEPFDVGEVDHVVDGYTARYDDAMQPRVELEAGESVLTPEQPDGREWNSFRRRMADAGLRLEWSEHVSPALGDIYELVADEADA